MKKIFVNGTFDVLHPGHIRLLNYARSLGELLIVAVDSDRRVKQLKGESRPFFHCHERKEMLYALKAVDVVLEFDSDEDLRATIASVSPAIMVVGSDWRDKPVIGMEYAKELRFYDRVDPYSTTQILLQGVPYE